MLRVMTTQITMLVYTLSHPCNNPKAGRKYLLQVFRDFSGLAHTLKAVNYLQWLLLAAAQAGPRGSPPLSAAHCIKYHICKTKQSSPFHTGFTVWTSAL